MIVWVNKDDGRFTDNQHNICSLSHIEHVRDSSLVMQRLAIFSRPQTQIDSRVET